MHAVFHLLFGATATLALASQLAEQHRDELAEELPAIVATLVRTIILQPSR